MVEVLIEYVGDKRCRAIHGPSRQTLTTDAPVDNHGKGEYFSPTDLVATALGACMATVMGIVAERDGMDLSGLAVKVEKGMVSDPERRIGRLEVTFNMPPRLPAPQRKKLERAARHCPVKKSLRPEVDISLSFVYP